MAASDVTVAASGGTAYIIGGYDGVNWLDTILAWRPGSRVRVVGHLPVGPRYAAAAAVDGQILIMGGSTPTLASNAIYRFDPATGHVRRIGRLPQPTTHATAATLGSFAYLIGGRGNSDISQTSQIWSIDPRTGRVQLAGDLPRALSDTAVVAIGRTLFVAGGLTSSGGTVASVGELTADAGSVGAMAEIRGAPTRRRVIRLRDRLRLVYGIPLAGPHGDGLGELILTVLSQSTNDRNRDVAYLRPARALPDLGGSPRRPRGRGRGGDSPGRDLAGQVGADQGDPASGLDTGPTVVRADGLELGWLQDLPVPEAQQYLCSLPGVGRKTAACVLLFAFGMRDVPVDTHVSRVGTRLGLFRPASTVRGASRHDAGADAARAGARAAPEHAAPRPPHMPRAPARLWRMCACAHMPKRVQGLTDNAGRARRCQRQRAPRAPPARLPTTRLRGHKSAMVPLRFLTRRTKERN